MIRQRTLDRRIMKTKMLTNKLRDKANYLVGDPARLRVLINNYEVMLMDILRGYKDRVE